MKFAQLLDIVGEDPLFDTGLLLAGAVDPDLVRQQLSRWVNAGRLFQMRRGVYAVAPPYQKTVPHPFVIANHLVRGSYVSCQSALAYLGMIPEHVPVTTSVTVGRPGRWKNPLGVYEFRHTKPDLYGGFRRLEVAAAQWAYVARPEKALLDLVYLTPGADSSTYLEELRLQNLEVLDIDSVQHMARQAAKPKLERAARRLVELVRAFATEYEPL